MNFLGKLIFNIAISALSAYAVYDYIPLSFFESWKEPNLGVSITTINGTDTISSSRSTINTNFSNLNNGKVENSTTSMPYLSNLAGLVQVGTLTSGTWNASTIGIAYGGTGTTTGKQTYGVLLGDGAYGITVASTTGTSGQFLTSNGANTYPSWQTSAVSQTADYNFTSTYFGVKNLSASSTVANPIILNTVSYNTPSTQGTVSTFLKNDGSGNLTWGSASSLASTTAKQNLASGTTTLMSITVPANRILSGDSILVTIDTTMVGNTAGGGVDEAGSLNVSLGGYATSTCGWQIGRIGLSNASVHATSTYTFHIRASSNTTQDVVCNQTYVLSAVDVSVGYTPFNKPGIQSPDSAIDYAEASGTVDLTTAQPLLIQAFKEDADSETNRWRIKSLIVQYLKQ